MAAEVVNFRPLPGARLGGVVLFRTAPARGIGNFRAPLIQIDLPRSNFIQRAEAEVPAAISVRVNDINLSRGGKIDLTA